MPTIRMRFPGGRYHATTWGHHVNEGQIEWPPSPWRLLRALIACGYSTQHWSEVPEVGRSLLQKLAGTLPSYRLPSACAAHSRHYVPLGSLDKGREKTTLVFDTWATLSDNELVIHWDCELTNDEEDLLARLIDCLGYLGRSESWVEASMANDTEASRIEFNAEAHREGQQRGPGWEQITTMAAIPDNEYVDWREGVVERLLSNFPLPEGKKKPPSKLLKERAKITLPYPVDLIDCLQKDTSWWKQQRWSHPPGSQRVVYWRRTNCLQVGAPHRIARPKASPVTTMLLAITSPSGNRSALPPVTRTLPQAELLHRALVGRVGKGERIDCPELTGRDSDGQPLNGQHDHAHLLPLDLDNDGHLDHILIHAPMGLRDAAQHAISTLRRTWTKGGVGEMQLALAGSGDLQSLRRLRAPLRGHITRILGPNAGATTWTSITPFVPPRFVKPRGKNSITGQVNAELESRGLPQAGTIALLPWDNDTLPMRHFVRRRRNRSHLPPVDVGYAIKIGFAEPLVLDRPLVIGYGAHFGLGLFGTA
ncbi:MAG: type I-U CRISPR-associated protein Cas5/Cas6 [Planctomycetales bacterium]|nr:type I-U CRISPR-associated protein Cas5/Cas6 [Planctomycetales bacterium]